MPLSAASPVDEPAVGPVIAADAPASEAALAVPSPVPLVDPGALQDLGEQVNSATVARGFARDYAQLWEQRYESLSASLARRDQAAALDAVLSVKTSSSMVGGLRLAQLASEMELLIRAGNLAEAAGRLGEVADRGRETVEELQFSYVLLEC